MRTAPAAGSSEAPGRRQLLQGLANFCLNLLTQDNIADHRHGISAGGQGGRCTPGADPANGDNRQAGPVPNLAQLIESSGGIAGRLGLGAEQWPKADIIRALALGLRSLGRVMG